MNTSIVDMFDRIEDIDLDNFDQEEDDNDIEIDHGIIIQGRFILDGADSLEDAAFMARAYANHLEEMHEQGYTLKGIISNDYGVATHG